MLFGGLDAFRRHLHAEAAAQADDGMNDGRGIGSLLDRAHETRIDLELVERKTPQIKQARIAGAEIIERKTHADAFEPQHREFRALEITEQGAFGEFEFKRVRRKAGLAENSLNRLDEIRPPELQRRNIDRDRHARPIAPVEAGAAQDVFAKLDNRARVFGDRNKACRRDFAMHRMDPARQRFDADQPPAAAIDNRLIDDVQLAVFDRLTKRAFEQFAVRQLGVHRRVIDAGAIAALVLGAIERHVGVTHKISRASWVQLSITAMPIEAPILMPWPLTTNGVQIAARMRSATACSE